jgi:hypothetical protein
MACPRNVLEAVAGTPVFLNCHPHFGGYPPYFGSDVSLRSHFRSNPPYFGSAPKAIFRTLGAAYKESNNRILK